MLREGEGREVQLVLVAFLKRYNSHSSSTGSWIYRNSIVMV